MSTVSATPQQMRDRLLQAIDSQSNICNMVVVLEVITCLEKYPITKEALEETRLGKLINDVRKKTKDEDLAKRAKKLLRNWQKLIEPGAAVVPSAAPGSTNGSSHPCRTEPAPPDIPVSGKVVPEVKLRNDVHNTYSPKAEKSSRKRRTENRDSGVHLPEKISKLSPYENSSSPLPSNGIMSSPDHQEQDVVPSPERLRLEHPDNEKMGRIPVNAVNPLPSSPGMAKLPSTSALIKAAVLQKARLDDSGGGGYHQARSPRSVKQDAKCSGPYALDSPLSVPSPSQPPFTDRLPPPPQRASTPHWSSESSLQDTSHLESPVVSPAPDQLRPTVSEDSEHSTLANTGHKRRKYRSRDYAVNLDGQKLEDTSKPVRLKERRLTFDPVTGQIKPLVHKGQTHSEETLVSEPQQRTESTAHPPPTAASTTAPPSQGPNPFQQTNWKELSRNEFIQSYLNLQSNVLTSSGVQAPSAHFFMSEYLKREEKDEVEPRHTHALEQSGSVQQLPGVTRELTQEDIDRIHTQHWPGVNGCRDSQGSWYDWTQCISLDLHGDESRLHILPYVCLD
ncbi:mediator of RNA polymerase II transcription subunit 26 [Periophthalmus magnuspinnatus]|uniref:Mediator of RNA polymerase II transcription subunit 26 n=1 Tax=Periophthalmus magnuspinnatus TaxID=409849 RepID=A0A3B4AWB7_9GOBI|nr:mediator of RNA polymerase II transcription subunit 26 [Periophthalmus magnuspinnatus]